MASIRESSPEGLIEKVADELQKMDGMKPPEWAGNVKTGVHKERPPSQPNWWWIRAASVLRKIYLKQPLGVSALKREYGGRKNRGHKPEHRRNASGAVIRKILQQLESSGMIKTEKGKGRFITPKGMSLLDRISKSVSNETGGSINERKRPEHAANAAAGDSKEAAAEQHADKGGV